MILLMSSDQISVRRRSGTDGRGFQLRQWTRIESSMNRSFAWRDPKIHLIGDKIVVPVYGLIEASLAINICRC